MIRLTTLAATLACLTLLDLPLLRAQMAPTAQARANQGDPHLILARADSVLATDSLNYDALWRGSLALIDLGKAVPHNVKSAVRDSQFTRAESMGRRAVRVNPDDSEGHFALAMALGNTSLTKGARERAKLAEEIYREASQAVAIDSTHDGAWHLLGRWNAEILRVSGLQRFFARQFLSTRIFDQASWAEAVADLERAVRLDPPRILHHLDLAGVYVDLKRWPDAHRELDAVRDLPASQPNDSLFKRQGEEMRRALR
jgi:Flp pilus assembly protein TadD